MTMPVRKRPISAIEIAPEDVEEEGEHLTDGGSRKRTLFDIYHSEQVNDDQ